MFSSAGSLPCHVERLGINAIVASGAAHSNLRCARGWARHVSISRINLMRKDVRLPDGRALDEAFCACDILRMRFLGASTASLALVVLAFGLGCSSKDSPAAVTTKGPDDTGTVVEDTAP